MTAAADFPAPGAGPRAGLWLSAAALALAAHGGAALWALRTPPPEALDAGAPAVMIEMAEAPAAAPPGEAAPGDHLTDAPEIVETAQERLPDPTPPDLTLPEAAALPPQVPTPSPLSAPPAVLPEAVLPPPADRPRARPQDLRPAEAPPPPQPDPKPDSKSARERPPKAEAEAQAAAPQKARTRAASQAAPREAPRAGGAAAGGGGQADADWRARVIAHLMRLKRYPPAAKRRGDVGRVVIVLTIDPAGNVTGVRLKASSGSEILDQAALALARRASPLPAPPPGALLSIIAPVDYASPR